MTPFSPWDHPAPEKPHAPFQAAGASLSSLEAWLHQLQQPTYRAKQIFQGLYQQRWASWEAFSNLPSSLRSLLSEQAPLTWPRIVDSRTSADGSTKHVFLLGDGRQIEGVHMPYDGRRTLCISSQVGCAMGCTFCATGQMGIIRNLTSMEIVGQVMAMLLHHQHEAPEPINLVFMGMGEPLHNLDHVMAAFEVLTHFLGLAIPPRRITVSTSGLVSGIHRLGTFSPRPRLAVSLNATTDEARSRIMPVNRVWNLDALAQTLGAFPRESGEKITLEYVLLQGITDTPEDQRRLKAFASRFAAKVNLIPFNPHEGAGFQPPNEKTIQAFCQTLSQAGITAVVRRSRGQDVAGACGQLVRAAPRFDT